LKGMSRSSAPLISFLTDKRCIWYSYDVEEEWETIEYTTDEDGNSDTEVRSGWKTIDRGQERLIFDVEDETGRIQVIPEHAEFIGDRVLNRTVGRSDILYYAKGPSMAIMDSTGRRRFSEHLVAVDDDVYVLGSARVREDIAAPEIAYDKIDKTFLISSKSEETLTRRYGCLSFASLIVGALVITLFPGMLAVAIAGSEGEPKWNVLMLPLAFGLYWLTVFGLYLTLIYNGLVSVMQRVHRAWSLIEVQLQRRFDLIPRLVQVTKGYSKHEVDTQEAVAFIRATQSTGPTDLPTGDEVAQQAAATNSQTAKLGGLMALAEDYPDLKASQVFQKLSDQVVDTEERISLARGFFNDSVTAYNDRIQKLPDVIFAKIFKYRAAELYQIHAFERAVVKVDLGYGQGEDGDSAAVDPLPE
ncbi:MAG: LemA family protein, partial [Pirellulaceae bacterium]